MIHHTGSDLSADTGTEMNLSRYRTLAQAQPELTSRAEVKCRTHLPLIGAGSEVSEKEKKGEKYYD